MNLKDMAALMILMNLKDLTALMILMNDSEDSEHHQLSN